MPFLYYLHALKPFFFLVIIGVMYMFVALAIVCDEFFVPALDVMIGELYYESFVRKGALVIYPVSYTHLTLPTTPYV